MSNKKEVFDEDDDEFIVSGKKDTPPSPKKKDDEDLDFLFEVSPSKAELDIDSDNIKKKTSVKPDEETVSFEVKKEAKKASVKPVADVDISFEVKKESKKSTVKPTKEQDISFEVADDFEKKLDNDAKDNIDLLKKNIPAKQPESSDEEDILFDISNTEPGKHQDDAESSNDVSADKKKLEELTVQLSSANDKYLRLMAEFDNFKRRSAKEYERLIDSANERLMKDLTEVRENFERAFKSNASAEKLEEGMRLIFSKLNSILEKHGLEIYAEAGQKFNPELHDALMRMSHETIPEDHIVEIHEHGYKLKGGIVKHAKVVVSSGKPQKKQAEDEAVIEIN